MKIVCSSWLVLGGSNVTAIHLKPGRDKSVRQRHPWIFSGAVDRVEGSPASGSTVEVYGSSREKLGQAAFSPLSNIRARMWSWDIDEPVDSRFIHSRLERAIALRQSLVSSEETDAIRLVHGESDGLPGVVIDQYRDIVVLQCLSAGAEFWRQALVDGLIDLLKPVSIVERSDVDVRALEGLEQRVGVVYGELPSEHLRILENGLHFGIDVLGGQKTGFYIDQRRNRQRVRQLVNGRSVLNCFSYTGAFSVYALAGGAQDVLSVDSSADALRWGAENIALNGFPTGAARWEEADVFQALRTMRDRDMHYDAIILDPPKFAPTAAQAERAARGYKDINLLAFKLLRPNGLLFTFSCSGGVSPDLFQKIVSGAAIDAGVDARIVERFEQGPDHPVALNFPEGAYLKGLVVQVV
jgi:23S rRNA (cytosine1962-C5)-methyltransferase